MSFYVKIENDQVVEVWDTLPPAGEEGWREAIEVNLPHAYRQGKHGHHFDLTKDPVEIVYDIYDIAWQDRQQAMISSLNGRIEQMTATNKANPEFVSNEQLAQAAARRDTLVAQAAAAQSHDELDRVQVEWGLNAF